MRNPSALERHGVAWMRSRGPSQSLVGVLAAESQVIQGLSNSKRVRVFIEIAADSKGTLGQYGRLLVID